MSNAVFSGLWYMKVIYKLKYLIYICIRLNGYTLDKKEYSYMKLIVFTDVNLTLCFLINERTIKLTDLCQQIGILKDQSSKS